MAEKPTGSHPPPPPPPNSQFDLDDDEPIRRPRYRRSGSGLGDLLTFRLMITPLIIQILFWIGTALCIFGGIRTMAMSVNSSDDSTGWKAASDDTDMRLPGAPKSRVGSHGGFSAIAFMTGAAIMVLGPLILRVYCELAIVFFKIHDELKEMNDRPHR